MRVDLGLDQQVIGFRNDQHDSVAGRDHAANSVHLRFQHNAVLRGADVDALELIFGGDLALDEFAELGVDLAHVLGDLAAQVLIDLDDLQLSLGDLAFGLGDGGDQLPAFALEPRAVALERGEPGDLHEIVFPELAHAFELLADQRDLPRLGVLLRGEAADLVLQLRDALFQLRFLAEPRGAAKLEQLALVGQRNARRRGLVGAGKQMRRET